MAPVFSDSLFPRLPFEYHVECELRRLVGNDSDVLPVIVSLQVFYELCDAFLHIAIALTVWKRRIDEVFHVLLESVRRAVIIAIIALA
jgi:hypothetical protein